MSYRQDGEGGWIEHYNIYDIRGSLRAVVDESEAEIKKYMYYPYGEQIEMNFTTTSRTGYIGMERDSELGLAEHGVRKYDDAIGRFVAPDALWEKFVGWSPYQYSLNNPVMFQDGNGYDPDSYVMFSVYGHDKAVELQQAANDNVGKYLMPILGVVAGAALTVASGGALGAAGLSAGSAVLNTANILSGTYSIAADSSVFQIEP